MVADSRQIDPDSTGSECAPVAGGGHDLRCGVPASPTNRPDSRGHSLLVRYILAESLVPQRFNRLPRDLRLGPAEDPSATRFQVEELVLVNANERSIPRRPQPVRLSHAHPQRDVPHRPAPWTTSDDDRDPLAASSFPCLDPKGRDPQRAGALPPPQPQTHPSHGKAQQGDRPSPGVHIGVDDDGVQPRVLLLGKRARYAVVIASRDCSTTTSPSLRASRRNRAIVARKLTRVRPTARGSSVYRDNFR